MANKMIVLVADTASYDAEWKPLPRKPDTPMSDYIVAEMSRYMGVACEPIVRGSGEARWHLPYRDRALAPRFCERFRSFGMAARVE